MEAEIGPNQILVAFDEESNEYTLVTVIAVYKTKSLYFYLCEIEYYYGNTYKRVTKILDGNEIKQMYIVEDVIENA